jgi:hypothetical protein
VTLSTSHITESFAWSEATCHDGTGVPPEYQPHARHLATAILEPLRARFGAPLVPISWYRTPEYNQRIGGALHSQHLTASGADIRPVGLAHLPRLIAVLEEMIHHNELPELGGFGTYPGWVHLDCRQRPKDHHIARWYGAGLGSEP